MIAFIKYSSILLAAAVAPGQAAMHTVTELDEFADDTSRRYTPFCITGTVQSVDTPAALYLVVSDASDRIDICNNSGYRPTPGEKVVLTGLAHMSAHQEIDISANEITPLCKGAPDPALTLRLSEITEEKHHLHTIVTEGTVIDAFPDEIDPEYTFLILKDEECTIPVALRANADSETDLDSFRDARIRVTGLYMRTVSGSRKFSGPFISADGMDCISIITPAPDDPFAAPPLETTLYRTPREIAKRGKRSVSGEILAAWGGNKAMLRTAGGRIVNIALAHGQTLPKPGKAATVVGYPTTDLFRINLLRAILREESAVPPKQDETSAANLEDVVDRTGGRNAFDPESHGRLMRIRGVVRGVPSLNASGSWRLLLDCGNRSVPIDLGQFPESADGIATGTLLEATGRCLLEIDSWNPDDIFPRIRNLAVVIRTPNDLRVVALPPWWTPLRLLIVISILSAALVGIYIWNRVLQHLVNRRGRELYREQVAHAIAEFKTGERTRLAVELHDSLSQELAGVACQVAAGAKMLESNPSVARKCIETADKMLSSCRTELRLCLFDLRSDTLDESDFSTAIRKTLDQLDGSASITVRFNVPRTRMKDTTAHAILAIVRELTGNAIRHGGASEVKIAGCIEPGRILFSVSDNGCGFDPSNCNGPVQGHFGLEGIRNRLDRLNGKFTIESKPGEGTKATIAIPLPPEQKKEGRTS